MIQKLFGRLTWSLECVAGMNIYRIFLLDSTDENHVWNEHFCVIFPEEKLVRFFEDEQVLNMC